MAGYVGRVLTRLPHIARITQSCASQRPVQLEAHRSDHGGSRPALRDHFYPPYGFMRQKFSDWLAIHTGETSLFLCGTQFPRKDLQF